MALKAYQAALEYGNTADHATATTWTAVARIKSIKPMKMAAKDIDITTLESADEFEEMVAGLGSGGELEASVEYDKTKVATLFGFFRTTKAWRLKYSDNSGWKWNGYLSEIGDDEVVNGDIVKTTLKVKVVGKPVHDNDLTS